MTKKAKGKAGAHKAPRAKKPAPRDANILDALSEVFSEVECLAQEMRDWADNMEEHFGGTSKYDDVTTAAEALEEIHDPVSADYAPLKALTITIQDLTPRKRGYSRGARLAHVQDILANVMDKLDEKSGGSIEDPLQELASALHDELEPVQCEIEDVTFPGMY